MEHLSDAGNWIVVGTTIAIVLLCVGLHFEVLSNCSRFLAYVSHRRRPRVLVLILLILATHVVEIWLFAFGYYTLVGIGGLGSLRGVEVTGLPDYAYFSAIVYATVGFGDLTPTGPIRFLTGVEALTGPGRVTSCTRGTGSAVTVAPLACGVGEKNRYLRVWTDRKEGREAWSLRSSLRQARSSYLQSLQFGISSCVTQNRPRFGARQARRRPRRAWSPRPRLRQS